MPTRPMPRRRTVVLALVGVIVAGGLLATARSRATRSVPAHLYERAWRTSIASSQAPAAGYRPTVATVGSQMPPSRRTPTATPTPAPTPSRHRRRRPARLGRRRPLRRPPTPAPTPQAGRCPHAGDPAAIFAHEKKETWCAAAGVQIVLTYFGKGDTSDRFQAELTAGSTSGRATTTATTANWGPSAMSLALEAYGVPGLRGPCL